MGTNLHQWAELIPCAANDLIRFFLSVSLPLSRKGTKHCRSMGHELCLTACVESHIVKHRFACLQPNGVTGPLPFYINEMGTLVCPFRSNKKKRSNWPKSNSFVLFPIWVARGPEPMSSLVTLNVEAVCAKRQQNLRFSTGYWFGGIAVRFFFW